MKRFRRFVALSPPKRGLLIRAAIAVAVFRLALWLLPSKACFRVSAPVHSGDAVHPADLAWAVKAAARFIPGASCLTQALALRWLLSRFGHISIVRIGVVKELGRFQAHAWVEHEGKTLLNTPREVAAYAPIAEFGAAR